MQQVLTARASLASLPSGAVGPRRVYRTAAHVTPYLEACAWGVPPCRSCPVWQPFLGPSRSGQAHARGLRTAFTYQKPARPARAWSAGPPPLLGIHYAWAAGWRWDEPNSHRTHTGPDTHAVSRGQSECAYVVVTGSPSVHSVVSLTQDTVLLHTTHRWPLFSATPGGRYRFSALSLSLSLSRARAIRLSE